MRRLPILVNDDDKNDAMTTTFPSCPRQNVFRFSSVFCRQRDVDNVELTPKMPAKIRKQSKDCKSVGCVTRLRHESSDESLAVSPFEFEVNVVFEAGTRGRVKRWPFGPSDHVQSAALAALPPSVVWPYLRSKRPVFAIEILLIWGPKCPKRPGSRNP